MEDIPMTHINSEASLIFPLSYPNLSSLNANPRKVARPKNKKTSNHSAKKQVSDIFSQGRLRIYK